jgi:hypothetical protein
LELALTVHSEVCFLWDSRCSRAIEENRSVHSRFPKRVGRPRQQNNCHNGQYAGTPELGQTVCSDGQSGAADTLRSVGAHVLLKLPRAPVRSASCLTRRIWAASGSFASIQPIGCWIEIYYPELLLPGTRETGVGGDQKTQVSCPRVWRGHQLESTPAREQLTCATRSSAF